MPKKFEIYTEVVEKNVLRVTAKRDGQVLGAVFGESGELQSEFWGFEVNPPERRQGLGTRLLSGLSGILKSRGSKEIIGELPQDYRKESAIRFYENRGFEIDRENGTVRKKL